MLDTLNNLIDLELTIGLFVEAEVHKTQLAMLVVALDEQVLKQLVDQDLIGFFL
jgi:hypothetical protein